MRILVTGGTGYIGGKLCEKLLKMYPDTLDLTVLVNNNRKYVVDSLNQYKITQITLDQLYRQPRYDYIFHIAALKNTFKEDVDYIEDLVNSNIVFSLNIYHYARRTDTPILFVSSYSQYIDKDPYCITKQTVENLVTSIKSFNKYAFIRLTDVYGEDDVRPKVFTLLKNSIENKEVFYFKSAENKPVNFTHIDFVTTAIIHIMENNLYGIFDCIYKETLTTLGDMAKEIDPTGEFYKFTIKSTNETSVYNIPTDRNRIPSLIPPKKVIFKKERDK